MQQDKATHPDTQLEQVSKQTTPKQRTVFIAGCGDVGSALGLLLLDQDHKVIGLRRNINQLPQGIQGISADLSQIDQLKSTLAGISSCDTLVYCAAATNHTEQGYTEAYINGLKNVLTALPSPPKHIFFTSSTGVYHQSDHDWVDEESECKPSRFSGQIILQAENIIQQGAIPSTVVRFSGIYGPGRNHLINKVKQGDVAANEPLKYTNRIHRDDCAGALAHLITLQFNGKQPENCYLASDDTPASMYDVTHWLAGQLNTKPTTETISRITGSKRCNNQRLKDSGYSFKYPSYQEGYKELLKTE